MNNKTLKNKISFYKKNGYAIFEKVFTDLQCYDILRSLIFFAEKNKNIFSNRDMHFTKDKQINSIHNLKKFNKVYLIQNSPKIKKIVSLILGKKTKNFGAEYFAKPAKTGIEAMVHQDNYYWCFRGGYGLTIWIALSRADKKNGGMYYYPGSQKLGTLNHTVSNKPGTSQTIKDLRLIKKFKKVYPKLKMGDCVVHDSEIVHGSSKNLSKISRRGLTLRYLTKSSKRDMKRVKVYEKNLEKNLRNLRKTH